MGDRIETYRPSNSDEGWWFISQWCEKCQHDKPYEEQYCGILGRTMGLPENDPNYPTEWVIENGKPRCTAFADKSESTLPARCDKTIDMFDAAKESGR